MTSRSIEAPGIELREIDRSQEQKPDYSLPNAPACLITGVASKGEDYTLQWINSRATLDEMFGYPTNEPETWFYNGICEILDRGGIALAAKLPYDNASLQKYTWRQWSLDNEITPIEFGYDKEITIETIQDIYNELTDILKSLGRSDNIETIKEMWETVKDISLTKLGAELSLVEETIGDKTYEFEVLTFVGPIETTKIESSIKGIAETLQFIIKILQTDPYAALRLNDSEITSYIKITDDGSGVADLDTLDKNLTYTKTLLKNKIRIYDITRSQYNEYDKFNCVKSLVENDVKSLPTWTNDCLGIVPVLVTAPNAMYFQNLLETFDARILSAVGIDGSFNQLAVEKFNVMSSFGTIETGNCEDSRLTDVVSTYFDQFNDWTTIPLSSSDPFEETTSREAALAFPQINWRDDQHYERDHLKKIGVVVFKAIKDLANDSRVTFTPLEAFVGSLDRASRDKISHASMFIDDVVNSRSKYIRLFSNADKRNLERTSTLVTCNQRTTSLGFHNVQCKKVLTTKTSIMDALGKILEQCKDANSIPLDLVVDGGVSNLAQLLESAGSGKLDFDVYPRIADFGTNASETFCGCGHEVGIQQEARAWNLQSIADTKAWRQVLRKFDDFCKFTRRDCLFLADGLRTFCLEGDEKLVRRTKPDSNIVQTILPKIRYIADALNSSYAAGWCNWFYMADAHSGDFFWCPPSIKAASICVYCDTYFHSWDAPAGMTRGIVPNVVDCAFSPTNDEAGKIYNHQWNYAISYPIDGIIMEGQKTFQTAKTALDRINVRRLMLSIEKDVVQVARRFLYEGNTAWLRQRFVDTITPILDNAVNGDGIKEYAIKCDEELNTTQVIENHELRCRIAVKPIKTVEFIVLDFMCTRQGANVTEEVLR